MAAKISEGITGLRTSCRFVGTALVRQGPKVADILTQLVGPHLQEGDAEPGFLASIVALGRRLRASINHLVEADTRVYNANAALTELRTARDTLTEALAKAIVRLRRLVLGFYLSPNIVGLSLQSPRQRVADPLIRQVEMIEERFGRDDVEDLLGPLADTDDSPDVGKHVAAAVETAVELRLTLHRLGEAQRDVDEAIVEKDRSKDEHVEVFVYTARTFEAYCRLAGERKLAGKVRPSEQRPGRRAEEDEPPQTDPEPAGTEADSQEDATA